MPIDNRALLTTPAAAAPVIPDSAALDLEGASYLNAVFPTVVVGDIARLYENNSNASHIAGRKNKGFRSQRETLTERTVGTRQYIYRVKGPLRFGTGGTLGQSPFDGDTKHEGLYLEIRDYTDIPTVAGQPVVAFAFFIPWTELATWNPNSIKVGQIYEP